VTVEVRDARAICFELAAHEIGWPAISVLERLDQQQVVELLAAAPHGLHHDPDVVACFEPSAQRLARRRVGDLAL